MSYTTILVQKTVADRIGIITLNRPDVRNAINPVMRDELSQALAEWENDRDILVIVLTGGPKVFAAGADIAAMVECTAMDMMARTSLWDLTLQMEASRKPIIAAIAGYCLGGGCELAMACDVRIATAGARFGQPEINVGIVPGAGGTVRLARLVGLGKAKELILTGRVIPAEEALAINLVNRVVPDDRLMDEALAMAKTMAQHSPIALGLAKHAIQSAADVDIHTGKAIERSCFTLCFASEDQKEAMRAFLEKRTPVYKGK